MGPWGQSSPNQGGYPTLPNSYGIGAQIDQTGGGGQGLAPTPQTQAGQSYAPQGGPAGASQTGVVGSGFMNGSVTQPPIGANPLSDPWALTGPANSR